MGVFAEKNTFFEVYPLYFYRVMSKKIIKKLCISNLVYIFAKRRGGKIWGVDNKKSSFLRRYPDFCAVT